MHATTDLAGASTSRATARRARFREAVAELAGKARSGDLVRMLLLPGALLLVGGFAAMFLGWWGAARTHREIEQLPYVISGGLIGLGMVVVGALLLASVMWIGVLQRLDEAGRRRTDAALADLEVRLRDELASSRPEVVEAPARAGVSAATRRSARPLRAKVQAPR